MVSGSFLITLAKNVAGHLRSNVGVSESAERADPFCVNRDVTLLNFNHLNFDRRSGSSAGSALRPYNANDQGNNRQTEML